MVAAPPLAPATPCGDHKNGCSTGTACVVHDNQGNVGCLRTASTVTIEGKTYASDQSNGAWCPATSRTVVPWEACVSGYCANNRCTSPPCDVTTAGPKSSMNATACPKDRTCVAVDDRFTCTMQEPLLVGDTYYRSDLADGAPCPMDTLYASPWPGCKNGFCKKKKCTRVECSQKTAGPESGGGEGSGKPCEAGMACVRTGPSEHRCTTGSAFSYDGDFFAGRQGSESYCPLDTGKIEPYGGCESGYCYAGKCTDLHGPGLGAMLPNMGRTLHLSTNGPVSEGRDVDAVSGDWSEATVHESQAFSVDFAKQGDSTGLHLRLYKAGNADAKRGGWVIEKETENAINGTSLTLLYYTVKCDADPGSEADMKKNKTDLCKNAWKAVADEGKTQTWERMTMSVLPGASATPVRTKDRRLRVKVCGGRGSTLKGCDRSVSGIYREDPTTVPGGGYGAEFLKEGDENMSVVLDHRYKEGNPWYGWHFVQTIPDASDPTNTYKFQYNSPYYTVGCNREDPSQCYELWDRSGKTMVSVSGDIFSEVDAHERRRVRVTSKTGNALNDRIFDGQYTETFAFDGTRVNASFVKDDDHRVRLDADYKQGWMMTAQLSSNQEGWAYVHSKNCDNKDPWKCKGHEFPFKVTVKHLPSTSHSVAPSPESGDPPSGAPSHGGWLANHMLTVTAVALLVLVALMSRTRKRNTRTHNDLLDALMRDG